MAESINKLQSFFSGMRETVIRFPLPAICAVLAALVSLMEENSFFGIWFFYANGEYTKILACLVLFFFYLVALKIFSEQHSKSNRFYYILSLIGAMVITYFAFYQTTFFYRPQNFWSYSPFLFFIFCSITLSITIAPFIFKKHSNDDIWNYNLNLGYGIASAFITTFVLFLGLTFIVEGLDILFDLDEKYNFSTATYSFATNLTITLLFLYAIPRKIENPETDLFKKHRRFLVVYILVPFISLYSFILLGQVTIALIEASESNLTTEVILFGIFGIGTYILTHPERDRPPIWINQFRKHFFKFLLFLFLCFIYTNLRNTFSLGISMESALTLGFSLAVIILSSYFCLVKNPKLISIPTIFCILSATIGFGGGEIANQELKYQKVNFELLLEKHELLVKKKITTDSIKLAEIDIEEIQNALGELAYHNELNPILPWFEDHPNYVPQEDNKLVYGAIWKTLRSVMKKDCWRSTKFEFSSADRGRMMDISNFIFFSELISFRGLKQKEDRKLNTNDPEISLLLKKDKTKKIIKITLPDDSQIEFNVNDITRHLINECRSKVPPKYLNLDHESDTYKLRLRFDSIEGTILENEELNFYYDTRFQILLGMVGNKP